MTHIDFYLSNKNTQDEPNRIACRLADKAFRMGHRIYIHAGDAETARHLDQLLWTFSAGSFVPHTMNLESGDNDTPVYIGHEQPPTGFEDVLISLSNEMPSFFSRFERVAEVVGASDIDKQKARERYRYYRDRGYELQTHNL